MFGGPRGTHAPTDTVTLNASKVVKMTYHSSEDSESVKVAVGLRFCFRVLVSESEAVVSTEEHEKGEQEPNTGGKRE